MKRVLLAVSLVALVPMWVSAQDSDWSKGHGYVYVAPGVATEWENTTTVHIGGGGEGFFNKYLGVGGDAGYLAQFEDYRNLGTFSLYAVGRFRPKTSNNKVEPFVAGGYTHFFRWGTPNGFNFGGGVNYWFKEHVGLRFEVRDNARGSRPLHHFVGFRIGLAFR